MVTTDELTMTCHNPPNPQFTIWFTLGVAHCMGSGQRAMTCIHQYQSSFSALKTLCAPPVHPSSKLSSQQPLTLVIFRCSLELGTFTGPCALQVRGARVKICSPMSGSLLSILHARSYGILSIPWDSYSDPHFTDEKTEAQRG